MPLTAASFNTVLAWTQSKTNPAAGNTNQGPDSQSFNLGGLTVATFNQLYVATFTLAASASQTIDVTSLTNLIGESFSFGHTLTLLILPTGSQCTVQPGGTNPLQWFFGGTTQSITVTAGGMLAYSEPVAGPGAVVSSSHKTLELTNSGVTSLTVTLVLLGSTT